MKQLISKPEEIELNESDGIQDLLGNPPGWILRSGIMIVFGFVLIMLGMGYFIEYPDTIQTKVTLTTTQPPIRIFAKSRGEITEFLVAENQFVEKGDLLIVMENAADWKDILALEKLVQRLEKINSIAALSKITIPNKWVLGDLQTSYSSLNQNLKDIIYYNNRDISEKKIETLLGQINNIHSLTASLKRQKNTLEKENDLALINLQRYQNLFKDGGASKIELEQKKTVVLRLERQLESMESDVVNNNIQIDQINSQILEIEQNKSDNHSSKSLTISEDIQKLKSEIAQWKLNYFIESPISGEVSLSIPRNKNETINPLDELMVVVPRNKRNDIVVYASLAMYGSGKVEKGMNASIVLDGYPRQEFGTIKGVVSNMSLIPENKSDTENTYLLSIELPNNLTTNYDKTIPFRQGMEGAANIITENKTILERVFEQFTVLINKHQT